MLKIFHLNAKQKNKLFVKKEIKISAKNVINLATFNNY